MHISPSIQQGDWTINRKRILAFPRSIDDTPEAKRQKLHALVAAMDRILGKDKWTVQEALEIQNLRQQRDALMKTFPKLRVVIDNT